MHLAFKTALAAIAALGTGVAYAQASCPSGATPVGNANAALVGNTVCVSDGGSGWRWQEYHQAGGVLYDYKRGPTHPVDPTTQVGNWSALGSNVTYTYGSGYTYLLCSNGSTYTFVPNSTGTPVTGATIVSGQVPCGAP